MNYDKKRKNNNLLNGLVNILDQGIQHLTVTTGLSTMEAEQELAQWQAEGREPTLELAKKHLPILMQNMVILIGRILLELLEDKPKTDKTM